MIDWDDSNEVEKFNNKRSKQWFKLYKKMMEARNIDDEIALSKAREAMQKHEQQDAIYRDKAIEADNNWI